MASSTPDWDGPDDPGNPNNWPIGKKLYHTVVPVTFGFICTFGSSIYTPARKDAATTLHASTEQSILPFSLYLLGLSFGPVIAGPASESFGRKTVYLSALPLFCFFTLGAGFSNSIAALSICRLFAGLFCSPGLSLGTGTIADVWSPATRLIPMTTYIMMVQSGSSFGPFIGGFVAEKKGWRWTQWVLLFAAAGTMFGASFMSETYKAQVLKKRLKKRLADSDSETDVEEIKAKVSDTPGVKGAAKKVKAIATKSVARPITMMFTELVIAAFNLYVAIDFGILNLFYAAFDTVFEEQYGFDLGVVGCTFLSQFVGNIVGWIVIVLYGKLVYEKEAKRTGQRPAPEKRLPIAMIGAPTITISLFWFAWTAQPKVSWISPVFAEGLFSFGNLLVFCCTSLYYTDWYGAKYAASAWSSNTFSRYLLATVFPLFADQMYSRLGVGWATSVLGFITAALVPIPFLFSKFGPRMRKNSGYSPEA